MHGDLSTESVGQRCREITPEVLSQFRRVGQIGGEQLAVERHLRVSEQDGKLWTDKPATLRRPLRENLVVRQVLEGAIEAAGPLEVAHQADVAVEGGGTLRLGDRQSGTLETIVAQYQRRDVIGHHGEQRLALSRSERTRSDRAGQQDLDVCRV